MDWRGVRRSAERQRQPRQWASGAVIIYALLAVLLWPSDRCPEKAPFIAARAVGKPTAKGLWLVLWGSLAYFAVLGGNRSSQGLHDLLNSEPPGEPGWVAWVDRHSANLVDHRGLAVTVVLCLLLVVVTVGIYLPRSFANGTIILAVALSAVIWVIGENFGAIFTNGATDVNSGPLLILLAVARSSPTPSHSPTPAIADESVLRVQGA